MKLFKSINENKVGYLISVGILSFSIFIIHKIQYKVPPLHHDILLTKVIIVPFLLFGLMFMFILLMGDKE